MSHDIACWKCGTALAALPLPFGRTERCHACGADLHACRQCGLYDPRAYQQCREPTVGEVSDKEHASFCDPYKPLAGAFKGGNPAATADAARAALDKLFGK